MRRIVLTWIACFGLYLLFAEQPNTAEICAAAVTAALAAALTWFIQRKGGVGMRARGVPWAVLAGRLARAVVVDSARVGQALARATGGRTVRGAVAKQPFRPGPVVAAANARRGIVILLASLAPNGFVVELQQQPGALLIHHLAPAQRSADAQWPV